MMSNAEKIRKAYKELLADGAEHSRKELFCFAREKNPSANYSEGMLTGALKTLTDPGQGYQNVGRATYQKINTQNGNMDYVDNLINAYVNILKTTLSKLERDIQIDPFELMDLNNHDKQKMNDIRECIIVIKKTIEKATQ